MTQKRTSSSPSACAVTTIWPPSGANLMALCTRLPITPADLLLVGQGQQTWRCLHLDGLVLQLCLGTEQINRARGHGPTSTGSSFSRT